VEPLALALQRRGYRCSISLTTEGEVCRIRSGPNGGFVPYILVHRRLTPPDRVGFYWKVGDRSGRTTLDVDVDVLVDLITTSIEAP
jgi:hypothetical protein